MGTKVLAESNLAYNTNAKVWAPPAGYRWRVLHAQVTAVAGSTLTSFVLVVQIALPQVASGQAGQGMDIINSGSITPGAAGATASAVLTGSQDNAALAHQAQYVHDIWVTPRMSIYAQFGGGAAGDVWGYEIEVEEVPE